MNQNLTYDLAFVGPSRRTRTAPEIVFIINKRQLPETIERLHLLNYRYRDYINNYLGIDGAPFTLPIPDLFGHQEFGFAKCGYCTVEDEKVWFRLQLRPYPWTHYNTLTIFLLTKTLGTTFTQEASSNQEQDVSIMTLAELGRSAGYGHATGGWVAARVVEWLRSYAKANQQPMGIISEAAPMHPDVIRARQAAAGAMISERKYGYRASKRQIYGWIRTSGAFSMNCYGDACDLGIYPDQIHENDTLHESVELGCHNLDNAEQQLTLLAGLATICQLARESS